MTKQKLNGTWPADNLPQLNGNDFEHSVNDYTFLKNVFIKMHHIIPNISFVKKNMRASDFEKVIEKSGLDKAINITSYSDKREHETSSESVYVNADQTLMLVGSHGQYTSDINGESTLNSAFVIYSNSVESEMSVIVQELKSLPTPVTESSNNIHLVLQSNAGLFTKPYDITPPELDVETNYNDDFMEVHEAIVNNIKSDNSKGLFLLHGEPGCGKTTYIRYLSQIVPEHKKLIFLPPNLADSLSSPNFINFLIENPSSILIIEDAENVIKKRSSGDNQAISNVLNISDGLLSDVLKISIIATFNCDIIDIDQALLRRGRMLANYKFEKLKQEKAQKLSDSLGFDSKITGSKTLAEIYNQKEKDFSVKTNKIGF